MKKLTKENLPKCNGKAQFWLSIDKVNENPDVLRIVYPDGKVEYCLARWLPTNNNELFRLGCTSDETQKRAQLNILEYTSNWHNCDTYFLGYL